MNNELIYLLKIQNLKT